MFAYQKDDFCQYCAMSDSHRNHRQDTIFSTPRERVDAFRFDEEVTEVFHDMIQRSVPGYATVLPFIGLIAARYAQADSNIFDLGCSLGAATLSMRHQIQQQGCSIIAVDNSEAMVDRCRENIAKDTGTIPVTVLCEDVQASRIDSASVVVLNLVLQFIAPQARPALIKMIYDGLNPGGVLILTEKLAFESDAEQAFQTELHHAFKRAQGYSDLEISQKRTAIENVLIPDSLQTHHARLSDAGFSEVHDWFQCLNFASLVAIK